MVRFKTSDNLLAEYTSSRFTKASDQRVTTCKSPAPASYMFRLDYIFFTCRNPHIEDRTSAFTTRGSPAKSRGSTLRQNWSVHHSPRRRRLPALESETHDWSSQEGFENDATSSPRAKPSRSGASDTSALSSMGLDGIARLTSSLQSEFGNRMARVTCPWLKPCVDWRIRASDTVTAKHRSHASLLQVVNYQEQESLEEQLTTNSAMNLREEKYTELAIHFTRVWLNPRDISPMGHNSDPSTVASMTPIESPLRERGTPAKASQSHVRSCCELQLSAISV